MTRYLIALFLGAVVATLAMEWPTARAQDGGDPCSYGPSSSPVAVSCSGTTCVICEDGTCRRFLPASCWQLGR